MIKVYLKDPISPTSAISSPLKFKDDDVLWDELDDDNPNLFVIVTRDRKIKIPLYSVLYIVEDD